MAVEKLLAEFREKYAGREDAPTDVGDWQRFLAAIQDQAVSHGNWAGIPRVIDGPALVLESRYPYAHLHGMSFSRLKDDVERTQPDPSPEFLVKAFVAKLAFRDAADARGINACDLPEEDRRVIMKRVIEESDEEIQRATAILKRQLIPVNSWYCIRRNAEVLVYRDENDKAYCQVIPRAAAGGFRASMELQSMAAASQAWDLDVELRAQSLLKELIAPHLFAAYIMTGAFIETSPRSGVMYLFRRCRPTIAMVKTPGEDDMRVLSVLCMHPIGHYAGTWCGVMTPTDDVVAHLLMMRGCEEKFWKKANHHRVWDAGAGL